MTTKQTLSRDMSLFDITMIGVGAMIGAGIFVLTGEAAGTAGPALILSFALNGIVTILTAMVYAELGSAIPGAGGGYVWVKEGLPGSSAFLAGWMSWFAHAVAGALYALGFGAFLFELLRIFDLPLLGVELGQAKKLFGVAIALTFAWINYRGSSETGLAGNIVTVAKVTVIAIFCLFGFKFMFFPDLWGSAGGAAGGMGVSQLRPFIPEQTGWLGILSAMGLTFIAFEGYEIIVQAGEEVENPRKNVPRAVFLSLAIVVPIYMIVSFVLIGASNSKLLLDALREAGQAVPEHLSPSSPNWQVLKHVGELGLAQAARQFVPFGAVLILGGGLLSTMSALNATTFSSTRVAFAMGRDKNLPDHFAHVSKKTRTPVLALLWTAALICTMVVFVPLTTVAAAADIMFLLLFLEVNVAVITIRKKYGHRLAYGYLMPFFPAIPIFGIVTKLALALFMFDHYPLAWIYVLIWLAVGFLIFRFYAYEREREMEAPPVLVEESALELRPHSVLVAVANSENAKALVRLGARIARGVESELVLLHAVRVPHQLPQRAATPFISQARSLLDEARKHAEPFDIPVSTIIRTGPNVANAVIHTAQDKNTDYIIMGWQGPQSSPETQIGKNIDRVLVQANCHAVVVKTPTDGESINKVLVPVEHPEESALALAVAAVSLQGRAGGAITILHVSETELEDEEKGRFRDAFNTLAREEEEEPEALFTERSFFHLEFRTASDPVEEIVRFSEDFDRIVISSDGGGFLGRKIFGDDPTRLAERARCPVILVSPKEGGFKFEVQQFFQFFREIEEGE